jgi:hypothetical protein
MYFSKQVGKKYTENIRERKSILEQNQHQYFNLNFKCTERGEMERGRKGGREGAGLFNASTPNDL